MADGSRKKARPSHSFTWPFTVMPLDRSNSRQYEGLIGTGGTFTFIPKADAIALGLRYQRNMSFKSANGRVILMPTYAGRVEIDGVVIFTEVVGVAPGHPVLLGLAQLEQAGLKVDPAKGTLEHVPLRM